jgi:hypothetical protein
MVKAKQCVPGSSRPKLASFLRQFDEALIIEGLDEDVIHQRIRVDADYRGWVAKKLGIEPGSPYGA